MANEENLNPQWKKGESGNPAGRPKGSPNRSTVARKWLALMLKEVNPLTGDLEEMSVEDLMTAKIMKKIFDDKDTNAYKAIMDSAFGAPKQEVEQTNIDRKPPKIEFTKSKKD